MWDVGGDSFDSLGGVGILEVADLSLDEPELQAVSLVWMSRRLRMWLTMKQMKNKNLLLHEGLLLIIS